MMHCENLLSNAYITFPSASFLKIMKPYFPIFDFLYFFSFCKIMEIFQWLEKIFAHELHSLTKRLFIRLYISVLEYKFCILIGKYLMVRNLTHLALIRRYVETVEST